VSLIIAAVVAGGGALVAGAMAGWLRARRQRSVSAPTASAAEPAPAPSLLARSGFDVELGDVIEVAGRELWLEQAWLLAEAGDPVAALFAAREATLIALPPPSRTVYLLEEVSVGIAADPPAVLESRGVRFERARRLPVRVSCIGKSEPLPWDEAVLAEYRGLARDALWVLGRPGATRAWQGRAADESEIVRWGGGQKTLEG